jgi:fucose permease
MAGSMRGRAVAGGLAVFVAIGAQQALYGPAMPELRALHHLSASAAAVALSVHFVGGLLGVLALIPVRRRCNDGALLIGSAVLITLGCLGFVLAPSWPAALVAAFVGGLGFGGIDGGINQVFTEVYAERGHGVLNLLHGAFGLGAIAGPLLVGVGYRTAFLACAAAAALSIPLLIGMRGAPVRHGERKLLRLNGMMALWVGFFVLHVGLESGAGGWVSTQLAAAGPAVATAAASGFWLAFTLSRFAAAPLCKIFSARAMTLVCAAGTVLAAAATPFGIPAYLALGVAVGPLFPTGLAWLAGERAELTPYVVSVSMVGGIAFPPLIGVAVGFGGVAAIPVSLAVLAVGCCSVGLVLGRVTRLVTESVRSGT